MMKYVDVRFFTDSGQSIDGRANAEDLFSMSSSDKKFISFVTKDSVYTFLRIDKIVKVEVLNSKHLEQSNDPMPIQTITIKDEKKIDLASMMNAGPPVDYSQDYVSPFIVNNDTPKSIASANDYKVSYGGDDNEDIDEHDNMTKRIIRLVDSGMSISNIALATGINEEEILKTLNRLG